MLLLRFGTGLRRGEGAGFHNGPRGVDKKNAEDDQDQSNNECQADQKRTDCHGLVSVRQCMGVEKIADGRVISNAISNIGADFVSMMERLQRRARPFIGQARNMLINCVSSLWASEISYGSDTEYDQFDSPSGWSRRGKLTKIGTHGKK